MDAKVRLLHEQEAADCDQGAVLADRIQVSFYENQVPAFAAPEIDRLYKHPYCSLSYFEMAREAVGASTYVARRKATRWQSFSINAAAMK
jgi:hypothetical protein